MHQRKQCNVQESLNNTNIINLVNSYENSSQAYLSTLRDLYFNYEHICSPRGQEIKEITNYSFKILKPKPNPIVTADEKRNKVIAAYTEKEMKLYNSCTNQAADFAEAASFWDTIKNPDGTVNSAYGHLLWEKKSMGNEQFGEDFITPWEWAKNSLISDKDSRQAFIKFSLPEHQWEGNKDQTCTMHGNFLIRNDELSFSLVMRSNDVVRGLAYDLPFFISLMYRMRNELLEHYPELTIGTYTHYVHSMHLYKEHYKKALNMLGVSQDVR